MEYDHPTNPTPSDGNKPVDQSLHRAPAEPVYLERLFMWLIISATAGLLLVIAGGLAFCARVSAAV
jgi:hypothetical protein